MDREKLIQSATGETLIFTFTNKGYCDFVLNTFRSIQLAECEWKLVVFCLDQESVKILGPYMTCISFFTDVSPQMERFHSEGFKRITFKKLDIFKTLLDILEDSPIKYLLYLDSDIVILKDPLPYLIENIKDSDILIQCDENRQLCSNPDKCGNICTGFIFTKNKKDIQKAFQYTEAEYSTARDDQTHFYDQYKRMGSEFPKTKTLPRHLFPNGFLRDSNLSQSYILHYNWLFSEQKKPAMISKGHWLESKSSFSEFQPAIIVKYPPWADELMEEYFYKFFRTGTLSKWRYLDVFWTNLYVNRDHSKGYNKGSLTEKLRNVSDKYCFTIVQHDDGIGETLPENTLVFSSGSARGDICIPLNYIDHKNTLPNYPRSDRPIFCSFVGAQTHSVRNRMVQELSKHSEIELHTTGWTINVPGGRQNLFLEKTSRSIFSLCPRGYGPTSFRFIEVLQLGAIPVFIWEHDEWLPFKDVIDYSKLCVSIHVSELPGLYQKLKSIQNLQEMRDYYQTVKNYFTVEGASQRIVKALKGEWGTQEIISNRLRNAKDTLYFQIEESGFGAMLSRVMTGLGIALTHNKKIAFCMKGCRYTLPFEIPGMGIPTPPGTPKTTLSESKLESSKEWDFFGFWGGNVKIRASIQYPSCPWNPYIEKHRWCAELMSFLTAKPDNHLKDVLLETKKRLDWDKYPIKIGVHIRRGDKTRECPNVPEEIYVREIQKILTPESAIFLTSDDPEMKSKLAKLLDSVPILWDDQEIRYNDDNKSHTKNQDEARQESYTAAKNIMLLGDCNYVIGTHNAQFTWLGGLLCLAKNQFETQRHIMINTSTLKLGHWADYYNS